MRRGSIYTGALISKEHLPIGINAVAYTLGQEMNQGRRNKHLLDGYAGIKFRAIKRSDRLPSEAADLYVVFKRICDRLKAHDMTPANAGNVSVRFGEGFFISASGSNLGCIEKNEVTFVERCDVKAEHVLYHGTLEPSSESIMHWLIYRDRPEAQAIIHAHDEYATRPELLVGKVEESEREEPYGTIELARMAITTFGRAERIIVLKNHGYVAIGPDLDRTCDLVVDTHLKLLGRRQHEWPQEVKKPHA
jgi:ribulose-5-phosphate 4-epimerase/fuculose-1-phosphate aldolase